MHSVRDRLSRGGGHPLTVGVGLRFLLDQDVYAATARHLADVGHDVVRAADLGLSRATDEELLMARRHWRRHSLSSAREGIESEGSRITPRLSAVKIVRFSSELAFARAIAAKAAAQPGIQQIAHRAGFRPV